jgi:hypothetical protein
MNKKMSILSLAVVILSTAIVMGITALPPETQDTPVLPTVQKWARDRALYSLEIEPNGTWSVQDITPDEITSSSIKKYTSGDLVVIVSHDLNSTEGFSVIVENGDDTVGLWVYQDGTTQLRPLGVCGVTD